MTSKTAQLIAQLVDRVSGPAANIKKSIESVGSASKRVAGQVDASARSYRTASTEARRHAAAMTPRASSVAAIGARSVAAIGGGYAVARTVSESIRSHAELERRMIRIGNTSDASREQVMAATRQAQELAAQVAMPLNDVLGGVEALVAAGRSLPEAMSFMPSVAKAAQASGAQADDIARTASSLGTHMKIGAHEMQSAFDILVAAGNSGEFELKDMARYLPSLAPAAKALGMEGKKGLIELAAMLQVIRKGSGTASDAATAMQNVMQKLETTETKKKFKEFGVDLAAAMDKGRKEGRNLVEVLEDAAWIATKGDLSKLPQLFTDAEILKGMRALMSVRGAWQDLGRTIRATNAGTVEKQLAPVLADTTAKIERMTQAWGGFKTALGSGISPVVSPAIEAATNVLNRLQAPPERSSAEEREDAEQKAYDAERARNKPSADSVGSSNPGMLARLFNPENFGAGKLGQRDADLKSATWRGVQRAIIERVQAENNTLAAPGRIEELIRRQEGLAGASDGRARSSSGMAAVTAREQAARARAEITRLQGELANARAKAAEVAARRAAAPGEIAALRSQQLSGAFGIGGPNGTAPGTVSPGLSSFSLVQPYADVARNVFGEILSEMEKVESGAAQTRASLEGIGAPVTVQVDTASLERTVSLAREANAQLRELSSNATSAARRTEQSVRAALRSGYSDYSEVG